MRGYEPFLRPPPEMAFRNETVAYAVYAQQPAETDRLESTARLMERFERREDALERMGWPDAPVPRSPADEEDSPEPFCLYRRRSSNEPGLGIEVWALTFGRARLHLYRSSGGTPQDLASY